MNSYRGEHPSAPKIAETTKFLKICYI